MNTDNIIQLSEIPEEYLDDLRKITPGSLTLFVDDRYMAEKLRIPFVSIATSLGLRYQQHIVETTIRDLQWHVGVRRVSAFDTSMEAYVLMPVQKIHDYHEAASFLRRQLFNILEPVTNPLTVYTQNYSFKNRSSHFEPESSILPEPIIDSNGLCPNFTDDYSTAETLAFDPSEDDRSREDEKKRWVDALTALVLGYVTRFNEAPPMHLIEAELRGKLLLSATRPSSVNVSGDMKIILPELNEIELRMSPLAATVYILFLCHPEGIRLKDIADYRHELEEIYSMVKPGASEHLARTSIDDLIDPIGESLQQKLSMTRAAVRRYILDPKIAANYIITGTRGEAYRIPLSADMIHLPTTLRR